MGNRLWLTSVMAVVLFGCNGIAGADKDCERLRKEETLEGMEENEMSRPPRIQLGEPVTVALAPPNIRQWGPYQFPSLERLPDGRIQVSFHIEADCAKAYGLPPARAVSGDEGKTWEMLPREHAAGTAVSMSGVSRSPGILLPNGDRLQPIDLRSIPVAELTLPENPVGEYTTYGMKRTVYRVEDLPAERVTGWVQRRLPAGSAQWVEERATVRLPGETRAVCVPEKVMPLPWRFPQFVVAPDGALLAVNYGLRRVVDGQIQEKCPVTILRSTDAGKSWDLWSEIFYDGSPAADKQFAKRDGFTEPWLHFMQDGSAICLLRTHDANDVGPMYWVRSRDNGRTWDNPAVFDNLGVWPQMLTLKNGIALAVYGRPGFFVRATADPAGRRWGERVEIVPHRHTCAYGALLPLDDDTALVAYSDFNLTNAEGKPCKGIQVREVKVIHDR